MSIPHASETIDHGLPVVEPPVVAPQRDARSSARNTNSVAALQRAILGMINANLDEHPFLSEVLERILALPGCAAAIVYRRDESGRMVPIVQKQREQFAGPEVHIRLIEWADAVSRSGGSGVETVDPGGNLLAALAPLTLVDEAEEVLCVVAAAADQRRDLDAMVQLVATYLSLRKLRVCSHQAEREARHASALVELLSQIQRYDQLRPACYRLVNELQAYLRCQRVAIGFRTGRFRQWRLCAISGMAQFDPRADVVRAMETAMREAEHSGGLLVWPPPQMPHPATLAHKRLANLTRAQSVVSMPLKNAQGGTVGAWLFLGNASWEQDEDRISMIQASAPHVAACLDFVRRHERSWLWRMGQQLWRQRGTVRFKVFLLALSLALTGLLMPLPYKLKCDATVQPVVRRYVAAPFDGVLERALVKPGNLVESNQVLARLDGREIRWDLASLMADYDRAESERRVALSEQNVAAARQSELKAQRLRLKIELLEHRAENLEIKSPISGIVISGDLEKAQGVPVATGQTLFEIGPLDQMVAEVAIPDEEVRHVRPGNLVRIRLDADPLTVRTGKVDRIYPRAEVMDGKNVFVAEVLLDNADGFLRAGMNASAKVIGPRRPLVWNLFHKPWYLVLRTLGG